MNKILVVIFPIILLHCCCITFVSGDLCPGHKIRCRSDQTCCLLNQGGYACCPYESATCCPDGLHCCPFQTTCDTVHGRCLSYHPLLTKFLTYDWNQEQDKKSKSNSTTIIQVKEEDNQLKLQAIELGNELQTCPDGKKKCDTAATCCSLGTDLGYSCCPLQYAVCCEDHIYCCPYGTRCDPTKPGWCKMHK